MPETRKGFRVRINTSAAVVRADRLWLFPYMRGFVTTKTNYFKPEDVVVDPLGQIPGAIGPGDAPPHDNTAGSLLAQQKTYVFKRDNWLLIVPDVLVAVLV